MCSLISTRSLLKFGGVCVHTLLERNCHFSQVDPTFYRSIGLMVS
jgi:hypothetical protein